MKKSQQQIPPKGHSYTVYGREAIGYFGPKIMGKNGKLTQI